MNRFPRIASHIGTAQFPLREKVAGPDDDGDDEEENYVGPDDDDDDDDDKNVTVLAALEEL
jgi:hypothetical protein